MVKHTQTISLAVLFVVCDYFVGLALKWLKADDFKSVPVSKIEYVFLNFLDSLNKQEK